MPEPISVALVDDDPLVLRLLTNMLTAGYAPFEQYSNSRTLTPSTDLYAIGATLYRCIAGRRPVDSPERINALHHHENDFHAEKKLN